MAERRTVILGTAGHVDHGKTALVRALTGVDTDRLDEEHRRGISIELGFAHLDLGDDLRLGIVDVPGHERFVRQMVSGAGGMDCAMLLIAADEGWMPQTAEHFDVLRLLNIDRGLMVITKMDLAEEEMVELIEEETRERVAGSFLEGAPIVRVSAQSRTGLEELRDVLYRVASSGDARTISGDFRLPIDRVFSMPGAGVVVTGTAWSGTVSPQDTLRLLPQDRTVRVREVQTHDEKSDRATAGSRVAVALHGVKQEEISRGDVLVSGDGWRAARRIAVEVTALPALAKKQLKQRARLHVHHAAREVLGRLDLLETDALRAGESSLARLHLEEPLIARPGDRIVLRSYSPMLTVAGCVVLDPDAPQRQKRAEALAQATRLRDAGSSAWPRLSVAGEGLRGLRREELHARESMLGLPPSGETDGSLLGIGDRWVDASVIDAAAERLLGALRKQQAKDALGLGLGREEARGMLHVDSAAHFQQLLQCMMERHPIFLVDDRLRADAAEAILDDDTAAEVRAWEQRVREAKPAYSPSRSDMNAAPLKLLIRRGDVIVLEGPILAHRDALESLASRVREHFREHDVLSIAEVKEWTQGSRKYVVPFLEWLDAAGYTRFDGKQRTPGPASS